MLKTKLTLRERLHKRSDFGFSLVELIVVIAVMAVLIAVLVPSLLTHVERTRAQKDTSAMSELTNVVLLAMSDMDVYDELLMHSVQDNVSCYIDVDDESKAKSEKISTKDGSGQYIFGDEARIDDETPYYATGNMRGVTITFTPNVGTNMTSYTLASASINKFCQNGGAVISDCQTLYNRIRSTIGDTIEQTSQTYRNSEYTIFIQIGSTGGNQSSAQDAIKVYGQYNGTNLPAESDYSVRRAGKTDENGIYIAPSITINTAGKTEETMSAINGTIYDSNAPISLSFESSAELSTFQGVTISDGTNTTIIDSKYYTLSEGGTIVTFHVGPDKPDYFSELKNGKYVITIISERQIASTEIIIAETIPSGGVYYVGVSNNITGDYSGATAVYTHGDLFPEISDGDVYVYGDYEYRYNMYGDTGEDWYPFDAWWYYQEIPDGWGVKYIGANNTEPTSPVGTINGKEVTCAIALFFLHTEIERSPRLPDSIVNMSYAFSRCENLTCVPNMPKNTDEMGYCFFNCYALRESPSLYDCKNLRSVEGAFEESGLVVLPQLPTSVVEASSLFMNCDELVDASSFVVPENITDMYAMFADCNKLEFAPVIPEHVTGLMRTFRNCSNLSGTITINVDSDITEYKDCFRGIDMSRLTLAGMCDAAIKQNIANTGTNSNQVTITN